MRDGKIEGVGRTYYESGFLKTELTISDGKVTQARNWPDGKQSPE
jgi:antitoxin component YwqK of YwqJK toxin-antitoxin module